MTARRIFALVLAAAAGTAAIAAAQYAFRPNRWAQFERDMQDPIDDPPDAWEWADAPEYPEKYAGLAFRLGVNYVLYTMTH